MFCGNLYSQNDTIQGEAEYRKIYDCRYEPGNILIVQKKGKILDYDKSWRLSDEGFVIRMEQFMIWNLLMERDSKVE